jgi:acetyl esterase/lipase
MRYFEMPLYDDIPAFPYGGEERGSVYAGRFLTDVRPAAAVYLADEPRGAMIVICPGGGYRGVSIDKEGHDFARLFATWGISSLVLSYRQPGGVYREPPLPLLDARRALRLCRRNEKEWKLAEGKLGIMGFSAGGHLALSAALYPEEGVGGNGIDGLPAAADFMVLAYPVVSFREPLGHAGSRNNLLGPDAPAELVDRYSMGLHVTPEAPPAFIVHSEDDPAVPVGNSRVLAVALAERGVDCELLLHPTGGHGYGLGPRHGFASAPDWGLALYAWLGKRGLR